MVPSVAILTPGTFPIPHHTSGSVESAVLQMAPHLAQRARITVLGRKFVSVPADLTRDGVRYLNFRAASTMDYLTQAAAYLQAHPPDIVQVENRPRYVEWVKASLPRSKVLLVLHSTTFIQPSVIRREKLCGALQAADGLIVNSRFLKEYITSRYPVALGKTAVNPLGVDPVRFPFRSAPEEEFRRRKLEQLGAAGKKVILYVGRLIPEKGVHRLLEAARRLKPCGIDFVLFIVGGSRYGENRNTKYVRKLKRMGKSLGRRVRFIPYVPNAKIQDWYRLADVAVTPSIGNEAFGLVNLEAMATGIPVVASAVGGIPEVIEHEKNGLLVPLENHARNLAGAIRRILANPELAAKLGQEGRRRVEEHFTWEHAANRLYRIYLQHLEER